MDNEDFEITGVEPRGRISAHDLGLWNDAQAEAFEPIVHFLKEHGSVPAVQLAHAGRKAGVPGAIAPSPLAFSQDYSVPLEMTLADIDEVVDAFRSATRRALAAGFQAVEIHSAHGYLLHEFLSPISNRRQDGYGGSFENRTLAGCSTAALRGGLAWPGGSGVPTGAGTGTAFGLRLTSTCPR